MVWRSEQGTGWALSIRVHEKPSVARCACSKADTSDVCSTNASFSWPARLKGIRCCFALGWPYGADYNRRQGLNLPCVALHREKFICPRT